MNPALTVADDGALNEMLRRSTVRIDVDGKPLGCGFFVTPNTAITCHHVISGAAHETSIAAVDSQSVEYAVTVLMSDQRSDLAVLSVPHARDHNCVLLFDDGVARDQLYSFGYPAGKSSGTSATPELEGPEPGTPQKWKLKSSQIQPGFSGSPVLNQGTGCVLGVMSVTRGRSTSLGGYAIRMNEILGLDSSLLERNWDFHRQKPAWRNLLNSQQSARGPFVVRRQAWQDMILSVTAASGTWEVVASGDLDVPTPAPVDFNSVRPKVARLFRDWALTGRVSDKAHITFLGEILYGALFPTPIAARLESARSIKHGPKIAISLHFGDAIEDDVKHLPWEYLTIPEVSMTGQTRLATDPRCTLTRVMMTDEEAPSAPSPTLDVLAIIVKPRTELQGANTNRGLAEQISKAVESLEAVSNLNPKVSVEVFEPPDLANLSEKLKKTSFDVVHYIGFGDYQVGQSGSEGTDLIALRNGDSVEPTSRQEFSNYFADRPPRLMILQSCRSSQAGLSADAVAASADFASFAPSLIKRGIESVVAYHYPIDCDLSRIFIQRFYTLVADGQSVQEATQKARDALWTSPGPSSRRAIASPALCRRDPLEHVLVVPTEGSGAIGG